MVRRQQKQKRIYEFKSNLQTSDKIKQLQPHSEWVSSSQTSTGVTEL